MIKNTKVTNNVDIRREDNPVIIKPRIKLCFSPFLNNVGRINLHPLVRLVASLVLGINSSK